MHKGRVCRWALGLGLGLVGGCGNQDADRMVRVGRLSLGKLEGLTGETRAKLSNGWQAVRGSLSDTSLDSRVLTRLRWDKGLAGTAVQVDTPGTGVVRLQGTVADDQQRRRAVDLAESTQGVEKVVDELTVGPAAESP